MQLVRDPIYQQLNQVLRELIRGREFGAGQKFLTERQVCTRFGVSRATANKALSNLVAEGLLEFRKGIGTFVRADGLDYDLRTMVSFTEKALAAGKQPGTRLLCFETLTAETAGPQATQALHLQPTEAVYYVERLRLAGEVPVILERRHIRASLCPGLALADLEGSLYAVWTNRYGLDIAGAEQTIRAVSIGGTDARLLEVPTGSPAFLVLSTGFLATTPLWWEETLYRGDAYEFHNALGPLQAARPAAGSLLDVVQQHMEGEIE